jgi:tRNA1Val (adenine37-N6)-methyltransferase
MERSGARHTELLSHDCLIENVKRLLKPTGSFDIILPFTEGNAFIGKAESKHLYCISKTLVYARTGKPVERLMVSFSPAKGEIMVNEMVMLEAENHSAQYINLTRDFYLNF